MGAIAWDSTTGLGSFEYDRSFLKHNWDLAPIKMPIEQANKRIFTFKISDSLKPKFMQVPISDEFP